MGHFKEKKSYRCVGLMSGTSLDGVDIADVTFSREGTRWSYHWNGGKCIPYDADWKERLQEASLLDGASLIHLHRTYGKYLAGIADDFLKRESSPVDLIASHGHTIFHQPERGMNFQLGDGSEIAVRCQQPVVFDFRSADIALGGQGAPLVPVGDALLFDSYAACLNLGGFANISFEQEGRRKAFDIGPCNILFNRYAEKTGREYDAEGALARAGTVRHAVVSRLIDLTPPRGISLGREWLEKVIWPCLDQYALSPEDGCATVREYLLHLLNELIKEIRPNDGQVLITGGGAFNTHLIDGLRQTHHNRIMIPEDHLVMYKEAMIFAFLGLLRMLEKTNVLQDVTGAMRDHCSGLVAWG